MSSTNIYLQTILNLAGPSKYFNWYSSLILSAGPRGSKKQYKKVVAYVEIHHILPICLCDNLSQIKDKFNKVSLTAREHFVAHLLLAKIFRNTQHYKRMVYAVSCFSRNKKMRKLTSHQYEKAKLASAYAQKGKVFSDITKQKLSSKRKGLSVFWDSQGKQHYLEIDDPLIQEKNLFGNKKGLTTAKDHHGKTFCVSVDDPRFATGEIVGIRAGISSYVDSEGKVYSLAKNDLKIDELQLRQILAGQKHSEETKQKMSIKRKGTNNSMYGRKNEVNCFDRINQKFCRVSKEIFDAQKGIQYVGVNNLEAKAFRKREQH